jgi:carboxyl-terminal processing protease
MKGRFKIFGSFMAGALLVGAGLFFIQGRGTDSYFEVSKNMEILANVFKELNTYYVDPVEPGKMVKTGIDAMLDGLDPYTNYITESDMEDYEFQTTGKYGGIGAALRKNENDIYIGEIYEGSPAQQAGLQTGDKLTGVDKQPVQGKSIEDISLLLKGAPGTQVTLSLKNAATGTVIDKVLTRAEIEISSVSYAGLTGEKQEFAYVKLTQFTQGCARMVRNALDSLKKINPELKGVVLDLRGNPGGLLDEAVNMCNLFVGRGQLVVSTKGKMPDWDKDFKTTGNAWDDKIPVTILISRFSASASEIVAGTLQDLDRAVVIGERSFGKGLVQTTRPLGYNARLKLTTAKYYTPSGRCIQAIDYEHRNADGSVGKIPDSLKQIFRTAGGRKVMSGGGVEPDVAVNNEPASKLAVALYTKSYIFDYATQYVKAHKTISAPGIFTFTASDFNDFVKWLGDKDYAYKTETENTLDSLKQAAIRDKYFDGAKNEFAALQNKVSHDKKQDLLKRQEEITRLLETEIIARYYYQRGKIAQSLRKDLELAKATQLLQQPAQYAEVLKGKG